MIRSKLMTYATAVATGGLVAAAAGRGIDEATLTRATSPPRGSADTVAAALVARGNSVFHGKAGGGTCFTCHQAGGKGLPGLAPDLTDKQWLHGDGSVAFLVRVIRDGVPRPRQSAAPMLPGGGVKLSQADLDALAAYVYSLSHPEAVRK